VRPVLADEAVITRSRVLVVDDDGALRELIAGVLEHHEMFDVVAEADGGEAALAMVARDEPDIVVLDIGLPDIAGHEVLTRMRQLASSLRVVVYTGHETYRRSAVGRWGADAAVLKGKINQLVAVLEDVASRPSQVARLQLSDDLRSARTARTFVADHLERWGCGELVADAVLVASELVANVLDHAHSSSELALSIAGPTVRIEVADRGSGTPEPRRPEPEQESGRGLQVVSALASAWGISPSPGGKVVWAELTR
jgi:DNA-binding response OmpR family regulator